MQIRGIKGTRKCGVIELDAHLSFPGFGPSHLSNAGGRMTPLRVSTMGHMACVGCAKPRQELMLRCGFMDRRLVTERVTGGAPYGTWENDLGCRCQRVGAILTRRMTRRVPEEFPQRQYLISFLTKSQSWGDGGASRRRKKIVCRLYSVLHPSRDWGYPCAGGA